MGPSDSEMPKMKLQTEIYDLAGIKRRLDFDVVLANDNPHMTAFVETQGAVKFTGAVDHKCDLRANIQTKEAREIYSQLVRERSQAASKRKFVTEDSKRSKVHIDEAMSHRQGMQVKRPIDSRDKEKRARIEKDPLLNLLFKQFEKQPTWTLRELITVTDQPLNWLKEVLGEIAQLHKKGPQKGFYTLKEEFGGQVVQN
eukprot:TRINITY_DN203_c0_g1_i1.p1 TRINITY_DN203_c0_g1~~TRINITY_DN203_c0_g1_i1.p1  ORF type:complete len:199 (-),score=40.80 TRINITY_DN203_c0_g1_i1:32-628(-)